MHGCASVHFDKVAAIGITISKVKRDLQTRMGEKSHTLFFGKPARRRMEICQIAAGFAICGEI